MFLLAMSCLQGRPMNEAATDLLTLDCDGLQLTPGNLPTPGFAEAIAAVPTLRHHGFSYRARRAPVWDDSGRCVSESESVHPPRSDSPAANGWKQYVLHERPDLVVETMYPGYELGIGANLDWAMDNGLRLAVDVSHLNIQLSSGVISDRTLRRLFDYDRIAEVHVSMNAGKADTHQPIEHNAYGLAWARAKLAAGTPVILESYFHRLGIDERARQVELVTRALRK